MGNISEDEIIVRYFAPIAGPGALGLKDDAALITPAPGTQLVLTKDALVAGVHFFADDPPAAIARKALRVNLSDLAAKGADPLGFMLALALPHNWTADWLADFARGLGEDARDYACPLLGGDTVKTPGPLTISITALGSVPKGKMVPRTGVRAGDAIYVTGTIGDAALGLKLRLMAETDHRWIAALDGAERAFLLDRYLLPQPRLALVPLIREFASGCMDISDGLVGDITKMLRASGVSAVINLARAPLSDAASAAVEKSNDIFYDAMTGGDDYELLCSVPRERHEAFRDAVFAAGGRATKIGDAHKGRGAPEFVDLNGKLKRFAQGAFSHF